MCLILSHPCSFTPLILITVSFCFPISSPSISNRPDTADQERWFCDLVLQAVAAGSWYPLQPSVYLTPPVQCMRTMLKSSEELSTEKHFDIDFLLRLSVILFSLLKRLWSQGLRHNLLFWWFPSLCCLRYSLQTSPSSDPGSASFTSEDCSACVPLSGSLCGGRSSYVRSVPLNASFTSSRVHWFSTVWCLKAACLELSIFALRFKASERREHFVCLPCLANSQTWEVTLMCTCVKDMGSRPL